MKRRWWLPLIGVAVVLLLLTVGWFGYAEAIIAHHHWHQRVRDDLKRLARQPPPDVSEDEWEHMVSWTHNLHANCDFTPSSSERAWREPFAVELERRLPGPVTVADIDWIWDEYVAHTKGGQSYSDNWRPTGANRLELAE